MTLKTRISVIGGLIAFVGGLLGSLTGSFEDVRTKIVLGLIGGTIAAVGGFVAGGAKQFSALVDSDAR